MTFTTLFTLMLVAAVVLGPLGAVVRLVSRTVNHHAREHSYRVYRAGFFRDLRAALARPIGVTRWAPDTGGIAMELISGFVTAPSTTQTNLTMATGDSLAIRALSSNDKLVELLQAWTDNQTAGILRIKSPRMHDNTQGIRVRATASDAKPRLPWSLRQRLYSQDVLTVDLSGSGTAGDIETAALLLYYEDLGGVQQNLIGLDELNKRGVNLVGQEIQITAGTAGGWSGSRAINADFDNFKADTYYALVGYQTDVEVAAIAFKGADTGNLRVGGPGDELGPHITNEWFIRLSRFYGRNLIPVFKSQNKAGITVEVANDENAASPKVTAQLVELSPKLG